MDALRFLHRPLGGHCLPLPPAGANGHSDDCGVEPIFFPRRSTVKLLTASRSKTRSKPWIALVLLKKTTVKGQEMYRFTMIR